MGNNLGNYNPIFYAQEGISLLYKALGMAGRVYRGYDNERQSFGKGDTVSIRKPTTFVAQDAPSSSAQDLDTDTVSISLNQWSEVRFALTDKELAYTGQQIIQDHIAPAMYALADKIDQNLCKLYKDIPWYFGTAGSTPSGPDDLTGVRQVLFDNAVPMDQNLHLMVNGAVEAKLLANAAFAQAQGAGQAGVDTQMRGTLGMKYGMEIFANQNVQSHTAGTLNDTALKLSGAHTKDATSLSLLAVDAGVAGTVKQGDIFKIAGDSQNYAATADATVSSNAVTVNITPKLKADAADATAVTAVLMGNAAGVTKQNIAFHRDFAALVLAPLPDFYDGQGVRVFTAADPITKVSLRARTYAKGDNSTFNVVFDVLYGYKTLDPNKAARMFY